MKSALLATAALVAALPAAAQDSSRTRDPHRADDLIVTGLLATLPPREFAAGMAEVIKYGLLGDAARVQAADDVAADKTGSPGDDDPGSSYVHRPIVGVNALRYRRQLPRRVRRR